MYAKQDIRKYAKQGDLLEIVIKSHEHVWIVSNKGVSFSVNPELLSDEPVEFIEPEIKQREPKKSAKPLTQAEKIQLEYLNSLR